MSFDLKKYTVEKVYLLFFKSLFLVLTKTLFWQEDWALGYHAMKFRHCRNIFYFHNTLSLKSFGNSWENLYMPCSSVIITQRFTCGERKFGKTSKSLKILWNWLHAEENLYASFSTKKVTQSILSVYELLNSRKIKIKSINLIPRKVGY